MVTLMQPAVLLAATTSFLLRVEPLVPPARWHRKARSDWYLTSQATVLTWHIPLFRRSRSETLSRTLA